MSKGDWRRPQKVSDKEFGRNWDRAFGKRKHQEPKKPKEVKK